MATTDSESAPAPNIIDPVEQQVRSVKKLLEEHEAKEIDRCRTVLRALEGPVRQILLENKALTSSHEALKTQVEEAKNRIEALSEQKAKRETFDETQKEAEEFLSSDPHTLSRRLENLDKQFAASGEMTADLENKMSSVISDDKARQANAKFALTVAERERAALQTLSAEWGDKQKKSESCREKGARCEALLAELVDRQNKEVDVVDDKYEKLWGEILALMKEHDFEEIRKIASDLQSSISELEEKAKRRVAYAHHAMAEAALFRRPSHLKKRAVKQWDAEWAHNARRQDGIRILHSLFERHVFTAFDRFSEQLGRAQASKKAFENAVELLPDLSASCQDVVEESGTPFATAVEERANSLATREDADRLLSLPEALTELENLQSLGGRGDDVCANISTLRDAVREHTQAVSSASERVTELSHGVQTAQEDCRDTVPESSLRSVMRDLLLIWTSLKELEASKLERRTLDEFSNNSEKKDEVLERQLDRLTGQTARVEESVAALASLEQRTQGLDEAAVSTENKIEKLQKMMQAVLQFLSELVTGAVMGSSGAPEGGGSGRTRGGAGGRSARHSRRI